jgi:chromate reductase
MRYATDLGATVSEAPVGHIPLYSADLEVDPWPKSAKEFFDAVAVADAVVIISPEYNYSIPGVLKNAVDWASVGTNAWKDKVVAIMGVSSHQYGTTKMQMQLRQALLGTGPVWVMPHPQVAIGFAATAFRPDGSLADTKIDERVRALLTNLVEYVKTRS